MRFIKRFTILVLLLGTPSGAVFSQESVLSSGGSVSGTGGTVSFSIGQVPCHVLGGTGGIITEGVEQPYEILIMEGIAEEPGIVLECTAGPNPAETFIKLSIQNPPLTGLDYTLCDLMGEVLQHVTIKDPETVIPVDDLSQGIYILTVTEKEVPVRKFKIIKK